MFVLAIRGSSVLGTTSVAKAVQYTLVSFRRGIITCGAFFIDFPVSILVEPGMAGLLLTLLAVKLAEGGGTGCVGRRIGQLAEALLLEDLGLDAHRLPNS